MNQTTRGSRQCRHPLVHRLCAARGSSRPFQPDSNPASWGAERFRKIFKRRVEACLKAKIVTGEVVHIDASLIRANVSWESLVERHVDEVNDILKCPKGRILRPKRPPQIRSFLLLQSQGLCALCAQSGLPLERSRQQDCR